jgi:hypothetical protein
MINVAKRRTSSSSWHVSNAKPIHEELVILAASPFQGLPLPHTKPPLDSALASSQFFMCSVIHSKRLSCLYVSTTRQTAALAKKTGVWSYFYLKSQSIMVGITLV